MCYEPSTHDTIVFKNTVTEESCMELSSKQELIKQLKEAKLREEVTYPRLIERMESKGKYVSLSTLHRVFAKDAEEKAGSFSLENTLMPIAEALLNAEDVPTIEDSPCAAEITALKATIHAQIEEIARLHELKDHLEERITFLLDQIAKKDARMDQKDEIIKRLMDKCL